MTKETKNKVEEKLEKKLNAILLANGFNPLVGFDLVKEAVAIIHNKPKHTKYLLHIDIYPKLATMFNIKENNIERDIRTAISKSNLKGLTNAEALYRIALEM